jgi:hypothetical protein
LALERGDDEQAVAPMTTANSNAVTPLATGRAYRSVA